MGTVAAKVWSMEVETYSLVRGLTIPTVPKYWTLKNILVFKSKRGLVQLSPTLALPVKIQIQGVQDGWRTILKSYTLASFLVPGIFLHHWWKNVEKCVHFDRKKMKPQ